MEENWSLKKACKVLCTRVKFSFGGLRTIFLYLPTLDQVKFQGVDHWAYVTGVPRAAQSSIPLSKVFYFVDGSKILEIRSPESKLTVHWAKVDSYNWYSVQIGPHIFQVQSCTTCRLLENQGSSQFRVIEKAPMRQARLSASYCSMGGRFVFATGGLDPATNACRRSVGRYDIESDAWTKMPDMNEAKYNHGSCTLGSAVFVFYGIVDG